MDHLVAGLAPATRAVTAGRSPAGADSPVTEPVVLTSTYRASDGATAPGDRGYGRWDNPTWASLLTWAPATGPSLRGSDVADEAELDRLRGDLIAVRSALEPAPTPIRDPKYKEALRTGGYWSP